MALKKRSSNNFRVIAAELKKDIITSVGSMFEELKEDNRNIKGEIGTIKGEIGTIKGEIQTINGKIGSMEGKLGSMATKEDLAALDKRLTWQIQEIRKDLEPSLNLKGMVENHEERLKKLENA